MRIQVVAAGALSLSLMAVSADAAAIFSFEATAGDVVGTLSGQLDLDGISVVGTGVHISPRVRPGQAGVSSGVGDNVDFYAVTGPASFGSGDRRNADSTTGSPFELWGDFGTLFLPEDYTDGEALSAR